MSHSFTVGNVGSVKQNDLFTKTGYDDIRILDEGNVPVDGMWVEGTTYIYRDAVSVRPIETEFSNGNFSVRIFAGSSPDDYRLALRLIEGVSEISGGGMIEPEDNNPMTVPELREHYGEKWINEHSHTTLSMILSRIQKNPENSGNMSGVHCNIAIGKTFVDDLMKHPDNYSEEYFRRARQLNYINDDDVYQGMVTTYQDEQKTREVSVTSYTEGVTTLLSRKADVVGLVSIESRTEEEQVSYVPLDALTTLLGNSAKWLSNDFLLLPSLQGSSWSEMVMQAKEHKLSDIFAQGRDVVVNNNSEGTDDGLTDEHRQALTLAPLLVFLLVAAADGTIDEKEVKAFQKELIHGIATDSDLMLGVIVRLLANFEQYMGVLQANKVNPIESIIDISVILRERVAEDEAEKFKRAMLSIGKKVAEASGGLFGVFGSKISKQEQAALDALAALLGVEQ